ncbi:MAG: ATP-binding protein [Pyrobaculum arsenaticum]|uniref:Uncharacterized protein n=2 Tax=Pyrobaculum arsenaticum TaxID=121277 RepID=A4WKV7_PYRAR|nr:ATP-binding protein [Pyrobaculum arsenaticum]ABP51024.1 hypothetical protein Pars_1467 [Pyrobaculum arsenaticum DSM 13514]MCY0891741.1 ATP-binding protein [Pyrobaculum arsenaticum]NYR15251.1 ATP-binding protein [Pyrobaculum arsenaticum]
MRPQVRRAVEQFRREYESLLTEEELEQCVREIEKTETAIAGYVCAARILMNRPPPQPRQAREAPRREAPSLHIPLPSLPAPISRLPRLPALRSWPVAAGLGMTAAALLGAVHPALALLSLPALYIARAALGAVHTPIWREGDHAVALMGREKVKARLYRVAAVFRDVHGMGPYEFANAVRAFVPLVKGVYYDGRDVYVLLEDGAEEARTALRRLGIVVEDQPSPPPPELGPKQTALRYAPLAALPLAASLLAPAALPFLVFAVVFYLLMLARDVGTPAAGRGIENNDALFAILRKEEIWSIARVSQLTISKALLVWAPNKAFLSRITKRALRQEHLAMLLLSRVRMMRAEEVAAVRQRVVHQREEAFSVAGLVEGKPSAFSVGRPNVVDALTFDLAEFTPYSFMLLPFQCGSGTYKLGWDDRGREVCIDPYQLESPHAVVIGKTGSGKTTWSLAQALQALRAGRFVVAIDPHGHWARYATAVVDARRYIPRIKFSVEGGGEEFSDVDLLLDVLRAAGVAVADVHYTVLLNALERAGGSADLPSLVTALSRIRDPLNALAVDMIAGRIKALARAEPIDLPTSGLVVVTTYGAESPHAVMRLITWLFSYAVWAKQTCPRPPCKPRLEIYIDEAHLLLRHLEALALAWRGLRKYGVRLVALSQDVAEFGGPLSTIIANSDTKAVLAIDPTQLQNISRAVGVDPSVLERVATEALPEERYAVVRFGGRAPVFIRLIRPEDLIS